ncbi:diguanylate phosphodiesterase [beta proteobacterium AAP51]|nr:diguanylate phosphodiesterase [beta proteobacterium AAP51]
MDPFSFSPGDRRGPLSRLLAEGSLTMAFQPIVTLSTGQLHAHEALVRGPQGMPLHTPDALFAAARREGLVQDFEVACLATALKRWSALDQRGRLFLNVSATALVRCFGPSEPQALVDQMRMRGVMPQQIVFEITEHEHVGNVAELVNLAQRLHEVGLKFALDDFGDGRSSLRLWSELAPDYVKIDKYFTADIANHAQRLKTLQALLQIAETLGSLLVAEGVETADDLRVLRDLGISFGQGYFLGRPQRDPTDMLSTEAAQVLGSSRVAVLPALRVAPSPGRLSQGSVLAAQAARAHISCDELAQCFDEHPGWHAMAFVDEQNRPIALISRQEFFDRYAKPYFKEIYGRKPAYTFANPRPTVVDVEAGIDELLAVLMSADQRYLVEGFVYLENGAYAGLGTGHQLVRQVTESRIEAARHANPLTFLPGNIPISEHIDRLCAAGSDFVACYADLSNFKPFNDHFGYWRGDEAIKLLARKIQEHCDPKRDFVGHVGGDDFVVLFQSHDWEARCERVVSEFNEAVGQLYDEASRQRGGIEAEDRHGTTRFFGFVSLYMGVVTFAGSPGLWRAADVANAAAMAKQKAKQRGLSMYVEAPAGPVASTGWGGLAATPQ